MSVTVGMPAHFLSLTPDTQSEDVVHGMCSFQTQVPSGRGAKALEKG